MNIPNIAGESQGGNIDQQAYNPSHIAPPLDVTFSFSSLIAVLDSDVTRPSSSFLPSQNNKNQNPKKLNI
ncbi:hypothetical protein FF1_012903 [Malus domestica]